MPNEIPTPDWAREYEATAQVTDLARDPEDYRVSRQSKVAVSGVMIPVTQTDKDRLEYLFYMYASAFTYYVKGRDPPWLRAFGGGLTAAMVALIKRSAKRAKAPPSPIKCALPSRPRHRPPPSST
jgi:hypothetical protein